MLNIYVCEDDKVQRELVSKIIDNIVLMEDYNLNLKYVTGNPYLLLENIDSNTNGIYFLDIDLNCDMNGLELAKKIREIDRRGFIIFVSSHSEMSYMTFTYKVEAMDFIIKGESYRMRDSIYRCILEAYFRYSSPLNMDSKIFKYKIGDKEYCVQMNDIVFFETSVVPHKIVLHGREGIQEFSGSMTNIKNKLDTRFHDIHRSFIINKDYIQEIDLKNKSVLMKDGSVCYGTMSKIKKIIV